MLFQDTAGGIYLYNAEQDELMQLPDFAGSLQAAVWDSGDPAVVAAVSDAGVVLCWPVNALGWAIKPPAVMPMPMLRLEWHHVYCASICS